MASGNTPAMAPESHAEPLSAPIPTPAKAKALCSAEGCDKVARSKGKCQRHYMKDYNAAKRAKLGKPEPRVPLTDEELEARYRSLIDQFADAVILDPGYLEDIAVVGRRAAMRRGR